MSSCQVPGDPCGHCTGWAPVYMFIKIQSPWQSAGAYTLGQRVPSQSGELLEAHGFPHSGRPHLPRSTRQLCAWAALNPRTADCRMQAEHRWWGPVVRIQLYCGERQRGPSRCGRGPNSKQKSTRWHQGWACLPGWEERVRARRGSACTHSLRAGDLAGPPSRP